MSKSTLRKRRLSQKKRRENFSAWYIKKGQPSEPPHTPALNKIMAYVRKQREANIIIKRNDIEMMTELVNVAKLIKNKQLRKDEESFVYLYNE